MAQPVSNPNQNWPETNMLLTVREGRVCVCMCLFEGHHNNRPTCFSAQVRCAASFLRNERLRNHPRILLQKRSTEGGEENGRGKVRKGLGTEP